MEKPANQFIEETQEAHHEVPNFSLDLLVDKLEYLNVKANFFENQTLIINDTIHKVEPADIELLKEEQELIDKLPEGAEVKKNLVNILKGLKNQRKARKHKKNDETFIRINANHRKLRPWKCSDCTKGKRIKTYFL